MKTHKKIIWIISTIFLIILISIGVFGIFVISHELYHYLSIEGKATGLCFGNCKLYNGNTALSSIYWNLTQEQDSKINYKSNENNAILFSSVFITIFVGSLIYIIYNNQFKADWRIR